MQRPERELRDLKGTMTIKTMKPADTDQLFAVDDALLDFKVQHHSRSG